MTQTSLDKDPISPYATLVTLQWGESNVVRLCRWTDNITINAETWTAQPTLSIEFGKQHGGTEDAPASLTIERSVSPFDDLSTGEPHAPVKVTIEECDPTDASNTRRELFFGWVGKVRRNVAGRPMLVKVQVDGIKSRLKAAIGVPATTACAWRFGDQRCGFDVDSVTLSATISALEVDGNANRITATFTGTPDLSNDRWRRGYVEVDGLRIQIRASLEDDSFDLEQRPPASWDSASASFVPGCDGDIETCRNTWDNESEFGGLGFAMPSRNPVFEGA